MHTTHSNTQYKNESSTVKWAQWDKTQSWELLVCSYVCASHCAQLLHTILHRTDLIVFPLTLQTITTARMMSIWGKGEEFGFNQDSELPSTQRSMVLSAGSILACNHCPAETYNYVSSPHKLFLNHNYKAYNFSLKTISQDFQTSSAAVIILIY